MKRLLKKFETTMMAVTFAEEGGFETAREMLKEDRRVLLAVRTGQSDGKTFKYALNTCKRVGANLDILYISAVETLEPALEQFLSELKQAGIDYRLMRTNGCLKQEIIDYTNSKKEILFAVTESSDNLDVDCKGRGKRLSEAWQNLKCPLVIVSDGV